MWIINQCALGVPSQLALRMQMSLKQSLPRLGSLPSYSSGPLCQLIVVFKCLVVSVSLWVSRNPDEF